MFVIIIYFYRYRYSYLNFCTGFVDMCVNHIPSPAANARNKMEHIYTGPTDTNLAMDMMNCDPEVIKLKM